MSEVAIEWHPVHDPLNRGRIVYNRLWDPNGLGRWFGAVSRVDGGWRALRYTYPDTNRDPDRKRAPQNNGRVELGIHRSQVAAKRAVVENAEAIEALATVMFAGDNELRSLEDPDFTGSVWDRPWPDLQQNMQAPYLLTAHAIAAGATNYGACGDPALAELVAAARGAE